MTKNIFIEFSRIQQMLLHSFKEIHPNSIGNEWLIGVPEKTELRFEAEHWVAVKHGAGICFTRNEPQPQLVVDAHNFVDDEKRIDALRLQQFMQSSGVEISFEEAEQKLHAAVREGLLIGSLICAYRIE